MACYEQLPIELIRIIASYTSYASIDTLSWANKRSWIACQDWTVLKGLLHQTHYEAFKYILQLPYASCLIWKQFALAGSRAEDADVNASDFLLWAPQLFALHRELVHSTMISKFLTKLLDPMAMSTDATRLLKGIDQTSLLNARVYAFCFCVRALSFELPLYGGVESFYSLFDCKYPVANCVVDWSCRALDSSIFSLGKMGPLWNADRLMGPDEWPVERDQMFAIALKALGLLSIEVKSAVSRQTLVFPTSQSPRPDDLKRSLEFLIPRSNRDIPFASYMELPIPYSLDSTASFTTCHLSKMATKSLIEDGSWSGVKLESRSGRLQSPSITAIDPFKFSVTIDDPDSDIVEIQSHPLCNLDLHGHFQISLKKSSGVALMAVQLDPFSQIQPWQGILTPFGFVGTTSLSSGEWFWLWKSSWCGKLRPNYDWSKLWGRGSLATVQQTLAQWHGD
jgi:hypothetical protein